MSTVEHWIRYRCNYDYYHESYGQSSLRTMYGEVKSLRWDGTVSFEELFRRNEPAFFTGKSWEEGDKNHRIEIDKVLLKGMQAELVIPIEPITIKLPLA